MRKLYKRSKVFRLTVKFLLIFLVLIILLIVFTTPITNSKFDAKLYNLTKDDGYNSIKLINLEKKNSVNLAKEDFSEQLNEIGDLEEPKNLVDLLFKTKTSLAIEKKQDYIAAYKKFSNSSYWDLWEKSEPLWIKMNEKQKELDDINKAYSRELYVSAYTETLLSKIETLSKDIEVIKDELAKYYELADKEYGRFTEELGLLYEKYY